MGNFDVLDNRKSKFHERDNGKVQTLWFYEFMEHVQFFPREFVVGATLYDDRKRELVFIANPNYIGIKNEELERQIASQILHKYPSLLDYMGVRIINPDRISSIYDGICHDIQVREQVSSNTYYLEQMKKYLENNYLNKHQQK